MFDGQGGFVAALLRPAKRPNGRAIRALLRRLILAIRGPWPRTAILVRADGHYACPEGLDRCEAHGIDDVFGLGSTATLRRGPHGGDTRFIVTNLRRGTGRRLYEDLYCQRGRAEPSSTSSSAVCHGS